MNSLFKIFLLALFFIAGYSQSIAQQDYDAQIIKANEKASAGDFAGALNDFNAIVYQYPNYAIVYYYRGNVRFRMNSFKEAIIDYDKSISIDSAKNEVFFYRAMSKVELNDFYGALEDINHVIMIDPNFGEAYVVRGEVKITLNQTESGCADIQKALDLGEVRAKISKEQFCK